ncbi:TetR/AcrR family transcriptional regulator [Actinopolymorpha alba]|uniref:TetR/AcrR family transcriptional regulator n=1 Tax=Actinopolymorpha alba TaxID=533267 RepID=UPI00036353B5|nr:TetR/AcrR family transcriptional regulator [Actinopolymorpha alba]
MVGRGRTARAHRILDAAEELILRLGYNKTTLDDVARLAGVPKSTIYLHWTTRDTLFAALLRRERLVMVEAIQHEVTRSADRITLPELLRTLALEIARRPLLRAALLQDNEVLGRLVAQKRQSNQATATAGLEHYLETLRALGVVRTDFSLADHVNVISMATYGAFMTGPMLPDDLRLSDERRAELIAETVHRTLAIDRPLSSEDAEAISKATREFLDTAVGIARDKLAQSLAPPHGKDRT